SRRGLTQVLACMATDFAAVIVWLPLLAAIAVLAKMAFFPGAAVTPQKRFLLLGRKRISRGYLPILAGLMLGRAWNAYSTLQQTVADGGLSHSAATQRLPSSTLYFFALAAPFVLVGFTVLGLSSLALLNRIRLGSWAGLAVAGQLWALLISSLAFACPANQWCEAHPWPCFGQSLSVWCPLALICTIGFSLGAWLPALRSPQMQANNSSKPTPLRGAA
ncbi:hypothetical protein, partial [Cognatilysobacter terrigena]|uniref:hypothetical protein n=1 Tax=Cognatilysobacter terrigena TaxID=2488749 RepID=UPI001AAD52C5